MPPSDEREVDRRAPEQRTDGPLARIPLQSRLAMTVGVVVGLFASIVLSGADHGLGTAALWIGVGGGFAAAAVLWIRARR